MQLVARRCLEEADGGSIAQTGSEAPAELPASAPYLPVVALALLPTTAL